MLKNYKNLIIIVSLILVVFAGTVFYFRIQINKLILKASLTPEVTNPEDLKAGDIGEVLVKDEKTGVESPLVSGIMPAFIVDTTGEIKEVKADRLIVSGQGTNFADGLSRNLTVFFKEDTLTISKNGTFRWTGLAGLKQLNVGMQILINSSENIRGKTEFTAKTIGIL